MKPRIKLYRSARASILLLMATATVFSYGRTPSSQPESQIDLNALIDKLQRKYSRMTSLEADFLQVYQGADGRVLRERGHVILKRPGKARWDYSAPDRKIFVSDGKNIFFFVIGEKHATRSSIKESVDPQIPFLFLLGKGNLRRDFSSIEMLDSERPLAGGDAVLKLVPKRAPEEFKQLYAEVESASGNVRRLIIMQRNGSRMDFVLSGVRENPAVEESQFQFVAPPGVSIVKAR
ncbi:MAG TPA: outer membrane lipoprotein chaperone LolA [Blastocatellia bacterium]|nr:outer membrane lipoprotein chaperone LolA [Blastocatellia bacterium]